MTFTQQCSCFSEQPHQLFVLHRVHTIYNKCFFLFMYCLIADWGSSVTLLFIFVRRTVLKSPLEWQLILILLQHFFLKLFICIHPWHFASSFCLCVFRILLLIQWSPILCGHRTQLAYRSKSNRPWLRSGAGDRFRLWFMLMEYILHLLLPDKTYSCLKSSSSFQWKRCSLLEMKPRRANPAGSPAKWL